MILSRAERTLEQRARGAVFSLALAGLRRGDSTSRPAPPRGGVRASGRTAFLVGGIALLRMTLPSKLASCSLPTLLDELSREPRRSSGSTDVEVERIEALAERLLRKNRFLRTTCLYRALVRYLLLRRAGLDVTFAMGVRETGSDIVGHAWIECDGRPFHEVLEHEYAKTFIHPAANA